MLKRYRLHFEVWGFMTFLIVMIPNFIWFAISAPNDILRADSITKTIDVIAAVNQGLLVFALCFVKNNQSKKMRITPLIIVAASCCLLYFACWIVYYAAIVTTVVILGLTVLPCLVFLFFAIDRKNGIAMPPILFFTGCHLISGVINFII